MSSWYACMPTSGGAFVKVSLPLLTVTSQSAGQKLTCLSVVAIDETVAHDLFWAELCIPFVYDPQDDPNVQNFVSLVGQLPFHLSRI